MRNIITIFQKEMKSYFASPIAYGVLAFFAWLSGFFFYGAVARFVVMTMFQQGRPFDMMEMVARPLLYNLSVIGLFLIPMITMRLFAEEKNRGTLELLVTSPVRDIEIILGKWLGAMFVYVCMLLVSAMNMSLLFVYGNPDWRPLAVGYLGLLLLGSALLAIGTFISNLTKNQIIAGAATFGVFLLLWFPDFVASNETDPSGRVLAYLSVIAHFEPFAKGVIDTKDCVFYVSLTFLGLFLAARSMESLRWRS